MGQITGNALAWAGFRSAGGMRKSMMITGGYLVIVVGIIGLMVANDFRGASRAFDAVPRLALGAQILFLGMITCGSILSTIQKDTVSKMLESHRLMPIHPRLAIAGYMVGCASPFVGIALVNFLVGGIAASMAGMPPDWWIAANVIVLVFCAFAWSVTTGAALYGTAAVLVCAFPIGIMLMSGGAAGMIAPSILMLTSPVLGPSVFDGRSPGADAMLLWTISAALQFGVALVFVEMGARRFRSADAAPISAGWGVLLVALMTVAALVAMHWDQLTPGVRAMRRSEVHVMATAAAIFLLIVSGVVVVSAVASVRAENPTKPIRMFDRSGILLIVAIFVIAAGFGASAPGMDRAVWTQFAFLVAMLVVHAWAKSCFARGGGLVVLMLVLGLVSLAPLLLAIPFVDPFTRELTQTGRVILQVSPPAMQVAIWSDETISAEPLSLVIQAAIAATGMLLLPRRGVLAPMLKPGR